jgi:hypothetical protein
LQLGNDKLKLCRNFVKVNNNALATAISESTSGSIVLLSAIAVSKHCRFAGIAS